MPGPAPTATLSKDQSRAMREGRSMTAATNHGATTLETQDMGKDAGYFVYVYNILDREYVVNQPPLFPAFRIPACKRGEKFAVTLLPAFVNERYEKVGTTDYYYKKIDGRKCATSLLNPDTYPGTEWSAQLIEGVTGNQDMTGNNLNAFGVFWSLTKPDDPQLLEELALFKKRTDRTMDELVKAGEMLNASGDLKSISPLMHFAMEYFGLQAAWHMSHKRKIDCPNCGEPILEGLAYHRNSFGDRCIIDQARYEASIVVKRAPKAIATDEEELVDEEAQGPAPAPKKKARGK